jgi:hypothetical protein
VYIAELETSNLQDGSRHENFVTEGSHFTYANANSNDTYDLRINLFPSVNGPSNAKNT